MYIPFFNKTTYSLLSSLIKVDDLIKYAKENNLKAIAICDDNMYGTMEFIKKCQKENINPIIGLDIIKKDYKIELYAKNYNGYQNLMKLSTIQSEREVSEEELEKYHENVICIISYNDKEQYENINKRYQDAYLGYQTKLEEEEAKKITKNIIFYKEARYLTKNESKYLSYLYRIRDGKTISDDINYEIENKELEIGNILDYSDNQGLIHSIEIAEKCQIEFPKKEILLPEYECEDASSYLFELSKKGLSKRLGGKIPDNYKERLSYELNVIHNMGFSNYFLVVYDYVRFAKKNHILVGPGRGSGAGSLVAYALGIIDIDPIQYDLIFERFLNPERQTMPDIDTDFPDDRREEVIEYVQKKYGKKKTAGIVTFGTLATKQVIRDVSRTLNIPNYKVDSLCKFIPAFTKEKLEDFYQKNESFKARIDSDSTLKEMIQIAKKIEGFPRHTSSHASGIVMSKVDLDEVVPLTMNDGMYLTGYTMEYLEDLGLLKMDFLGLKNLTILNNIMNDIKDLLGEEINFNQIPLDDEKTLKIFEEADTSGIFQFESVGMRNFLRRLKPNTFEDIFAAIALFRPGAAVNIDSYIRRRHGEEKITYIDESLEEITKNTYGILIYQEQIMQVANRYAGYTLGEADILRRAMSKKKLELLQKEEEKFIRKSKEMGHNKEDAKKIFDLILNFAGYGFNRSHSVAYSLVAYKMAYFKAHYKTIFFSNLLTNVIGSESKTHEYIMEAKKEKIEVEKPTISNSSNRYIVKDQKIIYPLSNIKSIGIVVCEEIEKAKESGPFEDIYDCFSRLYISGIGKKTFEILIYADVLKEFGYNRKTLMMNLDNLFNYAELTKDLDPSLVMKPDIEKIEEYDKLFLLEKEKEMFGFYLSNYPTSMYRKENPYCIEMIDVEKYFNHQIDTIALIDKIKVIQTKKGDKMAFVVGSDETGSIEYTLFPKIFAQVEWLEKGKIVKIRGKVEKRLDQIQIIVDKIKDLNEVINEKE